MQLLANNFTSSKGGTDVTAPSVNKGSKSSLPQCFFRQKLSSYSVIRIRTSGKEM